MRTCTHKMDVGRIKKLVIRSTRTKWMAPNKFHGIFFVHWSDQVLWSIITSKENVVVSFYHNTSCTIVLSYEIIMIIRIYSIIPIYLQVSKTEGLAELHWVIGLSVLEKINSICFQKISLVISRIRCPS